jgi:hypothetical protein
MKYFSVFFCLMVIQFSLNAKSLKIILEVKKDSNYIESYTNDLILRIYSGEKTHSLELSDLNSSYRLKYLPNGYFNLGVGFSYKSVGLSLASKVPIFLNRNYKLGDTKRFGIQYYLYAGRFSIDVLTSFLKGYYLAKSYSHLTAFTKEKEYQRPDLASANLGISVNYIFNSSRFSYKAAFSDTERQKKNAGSLIVGGSIFSYQSVADSSFVPRGISSDFFLKSRDVSKSGVLAFNGNLGYAYSLVFLKNGIITMTYIFGSGIQENSFESEIDPDINRWRFSMNHTGRIGVGYRFSNYYARLGIIRSTQFTSLKYNDLGIGNGTNFMQVSLGRRLSVVKKSKGLQN